MKYIKKVTFLIIGVFLLVGCANKPTNPTQITGTYVSPLKYERYSCSRLATELGVFKRHEKHLALAQQQRIKSSQVQEFWLGYGTGDSIEASELADVRGEIRALQDVMSRKHCKVNY